MRRWCTLHAGGGRDIGDGDGDGDGNGDGDGDSGAPTIRSSEIRNTSSSANTSACVNDAMIA